MKNLKKVLALALVVALMMGFATVASATDFTDGSDIVNQEAVDVMSGIEVINGYPDGSFRPEGSVTRAQMAKMIAYIVSGGEDVGDLYAGANSFSDCLTHWARGYIAYANQTGIVAGVGNGLFNPDGTVTGVQAAKMLLCTLGYDQDAEGYVGTNWTVNVLSDARAAGLLDGLSSSNMSGALSRADAAQMMFNALTADMVEYASGDIVIEGEGSTITVGGSAATKVTTGSNVVGYDGERDGIVQLCEQYFEDLELNTNGTDDYERPANTWTYGTTTIGTYAAEADATYTASTEVGDIYSDLGLNATVDAADIDLFVDGESVSGGEYSSTGSMNDISRRGTDKYGAQGALMEVYYDDDADTVTITIVNTYLAIVTDDDYTSDGDDGVLVQVYGDESGAYFIEGGTYAQDTVLLVQVADGEVQAVIGEPETVEVSLTRISSGDDLTGGGTTYAQANQFDETVDGDVIEGLAVSALDTDEDVTYTLYLDQYGNYIAVALSEDNSQSDLVYIYSAEVDLVVNGNRGGYGTIAKIVRMDGTVEEIIIGETSADKDTADGYLDTLEAAFSGSTIAGHLAELTYDEDDELYTVSATLDGYTPATAVDNVSIDEDDSVAQLVSGQNYYLSGNTVYIFVTPNDDGDDINDVEVITGGVNYTTNSEAPVVFAHDSRDVAYVVVRGGYNADNDNVIYFDGVSNRGRESTGYVYRGYLLGERDYTDYVIYSVEGTPITSANVDDYTLDGFYSFSERSNGSLALKFAGDHSTLQDNDDSYMAGETLTSNDDSIRNGILEWNSQTALVSNAVVVDLTDADDATENSYGSSVNSVSTLQRVLNYTPSGDGSSAYTVTVSLYVNDGNEVEALFITSIQGGPAIAGGDEELMETDAVVLDAAQIADSSDMNILSTSAKIAYYRETGADLNTNADKVALLAAAGATNISIGDGDTFSYTVNGTPVNGATVDLVRHYEVILDSTRYYVADGDKVASSGGVVNEMEGKYFGINDALPASDSALCSTGHTVTEDVELTSGYYKVDANALTSVTGSGTDQAEFSVTSNTEATYVLPTGTVNITLSIGTLTTDSTVTISGTGIDEWTNTYTSETESGPVTVTLNIADDISADISTGSISVAVENAGA